MAAAPRQAASEGMEPLLKLRCASGEDGESVGTDVETLRDHLERFLLSEVGSDRLAVKNAGDLLRNMLEENCKLEKQVIPKPSQTPIRMQCILDWISYKILKDTRKNAHLGSRHCPPALPWSASLFMRYTLKKCYYIKKKIIMHDSMNAFCTSVFNSTSAGKSRSFVTSIKMKCLLEKPFCVQCFRRSLVMMANFAHLLYHCIHSVIQTHSNFCLRF